MVSKELVTVKPNSNILQQISGMSSSVCRIIQFLIKVCGVISVRNVFSLSQQHRCASDYTKYIDTLQTFYMEVKTSTDLMSGHPVIIKLYCVYTTLGCTEITNQK